MKVCDHCGFLVFEMHRPCVRCAEDARLALEAQVPKPRPSVLPKVLKWLFIGIAVLSLAAAGGIAWILHSLGPMPSFG
ncbi:hypothetical protein [Pseudomonas tohonis]|uniref:hypothetical protein n=1 Tax=Pseudomonas tohonis TaxID=2725477 RepID=UPI00255B4EE6|nr:hypothetical protein [Pseudomonas tohonis]